MARYKAAPRGMREADLAREVGVPPWKLRTIRDQSRGWTDRGIALAVRAAAQADADIKGAASDAAYTLERLVLTITGLRDAPAATEPQNTKTRPEVRAGRVSSVEGQSDAVFLAIADLRLAAWFCG